jgi:hypothetical protein
MTILGGAVIAILILNIVNLLVVGAIAGKGKIAGPLFEGLVTSFLLSFVVFVGVLLAPLAGIVILHIP